MTYNQVELIHKVMDKFDFVAAQNLFIQKQWRYFDSNGTTPTIERLKEMAYQVLSDAVTSGDRTECGRFVGYYEGDELPYLELSLVAQSVGV